MIGGFTRRCYVSFKTLVCVSFRRVGEVRIVDGTMNSSGYIDIFNNTLKDSVGNML